MMAVDRPVHVGTDNVRSARALRSSCTSFGALNRNRATPKRFVRVSVASTADRHAGARRGLQTAAFYGYVAGCAGVTPPWGQAMQHESVALLVREGLARRRMSRQQLAVDAKISLSTLEKGLAGERPFTLATLVRLESALDIALRDRAITKEEQASRELGAYRREGVEWLAGIYLTLRPSFEHANAVYAYRTSIDWDGNAGHLVFSESGRLDTSFEQRGLVSMPYQSGQVYLVTNECGQYRLLILSRPSIAGHMHGLLSTLRSGPGGRLTPVSAPIALLRQESGQEPTLGLITAEQPCFNGYKAEVDRVLKEGFGRQL